MRRTEVTYQTGMSDGDLRVAAPAHWRRNQVAVTIAVFIGFTGFTLVMPFLPLYFEQLGVQDTSAIAIWSGLSLGVTPAVTAAMTPFWARVAERFGRKMLVVRSLASFAIRRSLRCGGTVASKLPDAMSPSGSMRKCWHNASVSG